MGWWANTQHLFYWVSVRGAAQRSAIDRITLEATGESTGDQDHLTHSLILSWGSCCCHPPSPVLILSSCLDHCISNVCVSKCSHSTSTLSANHHSGRWLGHYTMFGCQAFYPLSRPLSPQMLPLPCSPASACLFPSEVHQDGLMVNILQMKK